MGVLYKTHPHFIRCVVPNTHKQPGGKITFLTHNKTKTHFLEP